MTTAHLNNQKAAQSAKWPRKPLVYAELMANLREHSQRLGFDPRSVEQRSPEWFKMRLGVITGSCASKFLAGADTDTYNGYVNEKAAELLTGECEEEFTAKALAWGIEHEPKALACFEFVTGFSVRQVPFIYRDLTGTVGCSPDGVVSNGAGLELKCPFSRKEYVRFVRDGRPKPEETKQVQFCMWVTGAPAWYVAKYDPRFSIKPIHIITMMPDYAMFREFDARLPQVLTDLEEIYHAFGLR